MDNDMTTTEHKHTWKHIKSMFTNPYDEDDLTRSHLFKCEICGKETATNIKRSNYQK